jgi:hypothetical protein
MIRVGGAERKNGWQFSTLGVAALSGYRFAAKRMAKAAISIEMATYI